MSQAEEQNIEPQLLPGDHACWLYQNQQQHQAFLTRYVIEGLLLGQKVVCTVPCDSECVVPEYLAEDGVDPEPYLQSGQLAVPAPDMFDLPGGVFDPDHAIDALLRMTDQALGEGFTGLRTLGDMSWALADPETNDRLIEYECMLNSAVVDAPITAICHYDQNQFPPDRLLEIVGIHPKVVYGEEVSDNVYFGRASNILAADPVEAVLMQRMNTLLQRSRAQEREQKDSDLVHAVLNAVAVPVMVTGPEGIVLGFNHEFRRTMGHPSSDGKIRLTDLAEDEEDARRLAEAFERMDPAQLPEQFTANVESICERKHRYSCEPRAILDRGDQLAYVIVTARRIDDEQ